MTNDVKISKIEITIGDHKTTLTPEQVINLRDTLNKLFPETHPFVPMQPAYIPYPVYPLIERVMPHVYPGWEVIWGGSTSETLGLTLV